MDEEKNKANIKSPDEVMIEEKTYEEKVAPAPEIQAVQTETVVMAGTPEEPKSSKKSRNIFIAVLAVVFLSLGAATTAVIIDHNNKSAEEQSKNSEQPTETPAQASELKLTGNSLSDFDLKFLQLENEAKNKIYSPLSIKYALAMLKDGAAGDSKTQIESLIGNYTPKAYLNSENRSLANALAINETYKADILESYISTVKDKYNAEVIYDPFVNPLAINQWISDKTLGRVENLLQDDFNRDNDTILLLINALAIDMEWENKIQCSDTPSDVQCKRTDLQPKFLHENYTIPVVNFIRDNKYDSAKFNNTENARVLNFSAGINNYDIKKEIGEEKIIETIKTEYTKWLESKDVRDHISHYGWDGIERDADSYIKNSDYLKELYANYGTLGSTTDFLVYSDEDVKAFAKDLKEYDGDTLQYVAIMPKQETLEKYVQDLTADKADKIINGLKEIKSENFSQGVMTKIYGSVPVFGFDYDLKLKEDLEELGIKDVFNSNGGNLTDMTKREDAFVSKAVHKANIDFSNEGIKAAAVTVLAVGAGATGGGPVFNYLWDVPVEEIDLTFDKPFFFLIRDKATGEVWFTGTVYEPTINE